MSHISVPPLPQDKAEYRTLLVLPKHKGSNFPKVKSPRKSKTGLTQKYEQALAGYQPQGKMSVDSSSGNLCPITKFSRSENDSSHVVPTQQPLFEVTPLLRKQHQLSANSMESLLAKKNSTVRSAGGEVRPRNPNVDRRANVTEDSGNVSIHDGEYVINSETASPRNSLKTPMYF